MRIRTTLKKLALHVTVETRIVKSSLINKHMVGKAAIYFKNHFKNGSIFIRLFSLKSISGSCDQTMLFTIVVSSSKRSSVILSVVELTKEQRGCNSLEKVCNLTLVKEHAKI